MSKGLVQWSIFSWNKMLELYVKDGEERRAIELFQQMLEEGMKPDVSTYVAVLNACSGLESLVEGRQVHAHIMKSGLNSDVFVATNLISMYVKCGSIEGARNVFDKMPIRHVVTWNAMIHGYLKCGQGRKALDLAQQMDVKPDCVTAIGILSACAKIKDLEKGKQVHAQIIQSGHDSDVKVGSSLVDMYVKCGSIKDARHVFDQMSRRTVVTWTVMIVGYVKMGLAHMALELFQQMQADKVNPDSVTFMGILNACASLADLDKGRRVHSQIVLSRCEVDVKMGSSLVDMYAKCGSYQDALQVFDHMRVRNVVTWNAMILGCVKCEQDQKAIQLFQEMQAAGPKPNSLTFVGVLQACASLRALELGRDVHKQIIDSGWESGPFVGTALVDMYSKCGIIEDAWNVFERMPARNVVAWNSMILGCVKCGKASKAIELFWKMQAAGVEQDSITFVGALNACASAVALEEGRRVHASMLNTFGEADVLARNALVDMYAKCASIDDAQREFKRMPTRIVSSWNAMIGGYAMHGYVKEALELFEEMSQAGVVMNSVTFICLLSACSHAGLVDEGIHYFESLGSVHRTPATVEHYACIIYLLGHAGRLYEAEDMIKAMTCDPNSAVWMALLSACRVCGNVEIEEKIAKQGFQLDHEVPLAIKHLSYAW